MNKQLFLDVADVLESEPDSFNMDNWCAAPNVFRTEATLNMCGSTACVCGWVNFMVRPEEDVDGDEVQYADQYAAATALGISVDQADRLFKCYEDSVWAEVADEFGWTLRRNRALNDWGEITGTQAAEVLRRIARGEINL